MKILYLDCGMGAAGDMLSAALLELTGDKEKYINILNDLNIPGVEYLAETSVRAGITGTHMTVKINGCEEGAHEHGHEHEHSHGHEHEHSHDHNAAFNHGHEHIHSLEHDHFHHHDTAVAHEHAHHHDTTHTHEHTHHHSGIHDIEHIVSHLDLPEKVKTDILGVYKLIAEAESTVHGVPVTQIHFHEVGTMDAVADVTAACLLINELTPDRIIASPVRTGFGTVDCAHGTLPVPAPATALLLKGIPVFSGDIKSEMCTPTGAAIIKYFADEFSEMPMMTYDAVGYGMGKKDFQTANCLRAILGTKYDLKAGTGPENNNVESSAASACFKDSHSCRFSKQFGSSQEQPLPCLQDEILELSCNVDDMTAEEIAFAMDILFENGAKDVFTIPIGMKKSRPGTMICVICDALHKEDLVNILFKHTSTIGIREAVLHRSVLDREIETLETPYGKVRKKISKGYGVTKEKFEFDDLSKIAEENNMNIDEVKTMLSKIH